MRNLTETLSALHKKYGEIVTKLETSDGCVACVYDDECTSCKGNAMGN